MWRRLNRALVAALSYLIGDDVFISYSHLDAGGYADHLCQRVSKERGVAVYLDQQSASLGKKIPRSLLRRLLLCRRLVVVITDKAVHSRNVHHEVKVFALRPRPVIPIDARDKAARPAWHGLEGLWWRTESAESVTEKALPSEGIVAEIIEAIDGDRQSMRTRRQAGFAFAGVIVAAIISLSMIVMARLDARRRIESANRQVIDARAAAERQRQIGLALGLADESSRLVRDQPDRIARAALLAVEASARLRGLGIRSVRAGTALREVASLLPVVEFSQSLNGGASADIRMTPDGRIITVPDGNGSIEVWDVVARRQTRIATNNAKSKIVALSSGGARIALAEESLDAVTIRVFDTATGTESGPAIVLSPWVYTFKLSPDGKWLGVDSFSTISVWSTETAKKAQTEWSGCGMVYDFAFSPDGRWLGFGCDGLHFWNWKTDEHFELARIAKRSHFSEIAFIAGGELIAAREYGGTVGVWPTAPDAAPVWLAKKYATSGPIVGRGGQVAFLTRETVEFYSVESKRSISRARPCEGTLALSDDGMQVLVGCNDGSARVYDGEMQRELARMQHDSQFFGDKRPPLVAYDGSTAISVTSHSLKRWHVDALNTQPESPHAGTGIAFSVDGKRVATIDHTEDDYKVAIRSIASGDVLKIPAPAIDAIAFSRHGELLAVTRDRTVVALTESGFEKLPLATNSRVMVLAASPFEDLFAFADVETISICSGHPKSARVVTQLKHKGVSAIAFGPGDILVTGGLDGVVRHWHWRTDARNSRESVHARFINSVAVSRDGRYVASTSDSLSVQIWDTAGKSRLLSLQHESPPEHVAFDPSGAFLATMTRGGTIRVWQNWSTRAPEEIVHLTPELGAVEVAFSPDSRWLAHDRPLTLIEWQQERQQEAVCARLDRKSLTHEEWNAYLPKEQYRSTCPAQ